MNDATVTGYLAEGGHGCISVSSNIVPRACADLFEAWRSANLAQMAALRDLLSPLHEVLFVEPNPVPVKYAASLLGLCTDEVRIPLAALSIEHRSPVAKVVPRVLEGLAPANEAAA